MEARQAEDGRLLLGFYTPEVEEEIRGVGFMNHQSMGNLLRLVGRRPPCVAARVSEMEIELLGFANRRPKKRFATSVLGKDGEKLADLKGGSN